MKIERLLSIAYVTVAIFLVLISATARAQSGVKDKGDDDPFDSKSYFMFGVNNLSNNVYLGRRDTVAVPYFTPYIGYHFKNGLYAKGAVSYTTAGGGIIDLTTIEAGYDHTFGERFDAGAYLDKFFYNGNSLNVRASAKAAGGIYGQFTNDIIEPQVSFDVNFNRRSRDYVVGFSLDHRFAFLDGRLKIVPAVGYTLGTQNYYNEYFVGKVNKQNKKGNVTSVVTTPNKLVPMVLEFSTKGTYYTGKWLFTFTPVYAMPLSPATVTIDGDTKVESLSGTFYIELDICHR